MSQTNFFRGDIGTTRGAKVKLLSDTINLPGLGFAQIDDVATSDFTEALKASPLPGKTSVDDTFNSAIEGTLNVLRQAATAGIEKIVVTSSVAAILDPSLKQGFDGRILTDSDWGHVTREEAQVHEEAKAHEEAHDEEKDYFVYYASKTLACRKGRLDFRRIASQCRHCNDSPVLPGFVFGPFPKHFPLPSSASTLGTNRLPYDLIKGKVPLPAPWVVDVRDVAKAHVLTIDLPRKPLEEKRFLVNAGQHSWKDAVAHLMETYSHVKFMPLDKLESKNPMVSTLDTSRATNILGFKEFIPPEKMMEDVTDALTEVEKTWKDA